MRFLIISLDYPGFLHWLYTKHPGLEQQSYEEQMQVRMESLFGDANFYSSNLHRLGYEAWEVHANNEFAQKAWARRHGLHAPQLLRAQRGTREALQRARRAGDDTPLRYLRPVFQPLLRWLDSQQAWLYDILAEQVKQYRPDIILNQNLSLRSDFFEEVAHYSRLLVGQHASPLPRGQDLSIYKLIISSLPNLVEYFGRQGIRSELLRLGFESAVLEKVGEVKKSRSISFVGSLSVAHASRRRWLDHVCQHVPVEIWAPDASELRKGSAIVGCHRGTAWGADMYRILRRSQITLNRHIDVAGSYANNMRLFEATGMGTLLITDWKKNLHDMFEPGKEVVAYRNTEECVELIRYYLERDNERETIAEAGQQRTLREHTYYQRMQELVDIVQSCL